MSGPAGGHHLSRAVRRIAIPLLVGAALLVEFSRPVARAEDRVVPAAATGLPDVSLGNIETGTMVIRDGESFRALPLLSESFEIDVKGTLVRARVLQRFENPTDQVVEAVYVFPLVDGASIDEMELSAGSRTIVAVVEERRAARREYELALSEGRKAALVERSCNDCYRLSVAGVNPGEALEVRVGYRHEIAAAAGRFSLEVPLTATPRYRLGSADSARRAPRVSTAGEFLHDGPRSSRTPRARVRVRLDAGSEILELESPTHEHDVYFEDDAWVVETGGETIAADRDFVLEWTVTPGLRPAGTLFVEPGGADAAHANQSYGLVTLFPPEELFPGSWLASRTLFVVDVSGSMAGPSIAQARRALLAALGRLGDEDEFSILAFNHEHQAMAGEFVPADPFWLEAGRDFVRGLGAGGGTEIGAALGAALAMMRDESDRDHFVERIVFLTDGAVSGAGDLIDDLESDLGATRVHAIGLGHAPNHSFVRRLARAGRGLAEFVVPGHAAEARIDEFFARLDRPLLTDLTLEIDGAQVVDSYPDPLPDLHAGEPLVISVRISGARPAPSATLRAVSVDGPVEFPLEVRGAGATRAGIGARWATRRVLHLLDEMTTADEVRDEVVRLGRRFRLVTPFTSLVAVDASPSASGRHATHSIALALPPGGAGRGVLPRGGTAGRIIQLAGASLLAAGAVLLLAPGLARRRETRP
jgi:Ca-activated chloride channel family protein